MAPRWLPLESNPEVMNKYIHALGVDSRWEFTDVLGLDPELLCMIPQPVFALLLLFPITEKYEAFRKEEEEQVSKEGQTLSPQVYFTKQTIGNACGTVGIIHSIANNQDRLQIGDGDLKDFLERTKAMNPDERAKALESCEGISVAHESTALEGQTEAPSVDDKTNLHFIALVERDGHLYELDGRKPFPINHGTTSAESFLQDAAQVCRKFMERDPNEINFNVVALASAS